MGIEDPVETEIVLCTAMALESKASLFKFWTPKAVSSNILSCRRHHLCPGVINGQVSFLKKNI